MSTALTASQTRFLRGQAHDLKALLQIGGKGVSKIERRVHFECRMLTVIG